MSQDADLGGELNAIGPEFPPAQRRNVFLPLGCNTDSELQSTWERLAGTTLFCSRRNVLDIECGICIFTRGSLSYENAVEVWKMFDDHKDVWEYDPLAVKFLRIDPDYFTTYYYPHP